MTAPLLEPPVTRWHCPACHREDCTKIAGPHTQYHQCAALKGAWVPFVEEGTKAGLVVNGRDDYLGTDIPTVDGEGRPVMSVNVERDDGNDCFIFAPCATALINKDD